MRKPCLILTLLFLIPHLLFCQNLPNVSAYLGKKIITIVKNRDINSDSLLRRPLIIDSSQNSTIVTYWESSFIINGQNIKLHTRPTRLGIAYKDNSNYFFDSNKPTKLTPILDMLYHESSDRLINKKMEENVILKALPELYEIRSLDTLRFSTLFFTQNTARKLTINDTWADSTRQKYVTVADTFVVKSIDKNIVTLAFRNKMTVDPKAFEEAEKSDGKTSMGFFNTADYVQGSIVFDMRTLFIHSITGIITVFAGSQTNGMTRKWHSFQTSFSLLNTVEL